MARQNLDDFETFPAAVDFSTKRGCAATVNTSGQAALTAVGAMPDGIIDDSVGAGGQARLMKKVGARQPMQAGGAITVGAKLAVVATTGQIVVAVSGNVIIGKALTAASGAGIMFEGLYQQYAGIAP